VAITVVSKNRKLTWFALIALVPALLLAAIAGRWVYMIATATPLHPNSQDVKSVTRSAPSPTWAGAVEQARTLVCASVTEQNLPGLSVAVGVGDNIAWAEGFGWADLENRVPVAPEMRFRTGGISMAITSAAVGLLLENGRLKLDDEIQTYVPAFPKKPWPVTLRQLMGHLAGVREDHGDEELLSERCDRTVDGLRRFEDGPLLFEPGTRYSYSTYGWILVSAAVEAAANERFFTFMRTQIFEPLGMNDTTPDSESEPLANRATFYYPRFAGNTRFGPEPARTGDYACFAGAGGLLSTPSDLVRFGMAINGGTLLQPATVTMLQTAQRLSSGKETGYGLGWDLETGSIAGDTARLVGHDGEYTIGSSTSLLTVSDRGIVVAVTTNITYADTSSLALKIAQVFADTRANPARK
jgi:serine beta-lactamase-like protein LACTB